MQQLKITITADALIQRVRRRARREGESFHINRSERWARDLGNYYTVDAGNYLSARWDSLAEIEVYAREAGILKPYEAVEAVAA